MIRCLQRHQRQHVLSVFPNIIRKNRYFLKFSDYYHATLFSLILFQDASSTVFDGFIQGLKGGKIEQNENFNEKNSKSSIVQELEKHFSRIPLMFSSSANNPVEKVELDIGILSDAASSIEIPLKTWSYLILQFSVQMILSLMISLRWLQLLTVRNSSGKVGFLLIYDMFCSSFLMNCYLFVTDEKNERKQLFEGSTVDSKPRMRTQEEILTQYKFGGVNMQSYMP